MHSTWTRFAGLPFVFHLVRSIKLEEIIKRVGIRTRQYTAVQLTILIIALRIVGVVRISHVNQLEDFLLRASLGFQTLPDQSTLNRFLGKIDRGQRRLLFSLATKSLVEAGKVQGEILAIDAHFIPYYGKNSPLAKEGYSTTKGKCLPGFKLISVMDVESGFTLAYRLLPGDVDVRRMLPRLLRDTFELIKKESVKYVLIDKGFYGQDVFYRLAADKVFFIIPAKKHKSIIRALLDLDEQVKDELVFGENIIETTYTLKKSKRKLRLIFRFFPKERDGKDELCGYLTNNFCDETLEIVEKYRKRWHLENAFAELKNDWHIDKLPSSSFEKIDTFIMLTLIAYNLTVYLKGHLKELAKARISTLRHKLINLSAAIKRAAGLVYVDAVFKEHLPRGRIKFDLSAINNHLSEVIYN